MTAKDLSVVEDNPALLKHQSFIEVASGDQSVMERRVLNIFLFEAQELIAEAIDKRDFDRNIKITIYIDDVLDVLKVGRKRLPEVHEAFNALQYRKFSFDVFERGNVPQIKTRNLTVFTEISPGTSDVTFAINGGVLPVLSAAQACGELSLHTQNEFRKKNSILLWELSSLAYSQGLTRTEPFTLDSLRSFFGVEGRYPSTGELMRRVIQPACKEVSTSSQYTVKPKPHRNGKKFDRISFEVQGKEDFGLSSSTSSLKDDPVYQWYRDFGFSVTSTTTLFHDYGREYLKEKLEIWEAVVAHGDHKKIKNPHGWMRKCISEDFDNIYKHNTLTQTELALGAEKTAHQSTVEAITNLVDRLFYGDVVSDTVVREMLDEVASMWRTVPQSEREVVLRKHRRDVQKKLDDLEIDRSNLENRLEATEASNSEPVRALRSVPSHVRDPKASTKKAIACVERQLQNGTKVQSLYDELLSEIEAA